ncbi:MAG: magnesium/cobalt transporter CorA [Gammaproteobacteria bacterium]|nr:magnesium/cobalt transporter CorA [Gammaproteobacteria bacterium]
MSGLRAMIYEPGGGLRTGGEELLGQQPATPGAWIWVDLDGVDKDRERELLEQQFHINRLAIQDAQRERHPPKQELFDDCVFLLLRELDIDETSANDPSLTHLALFVGDNFLVTRRQGAASAVDPVWKSSTVGQLERGPAHIVYRICRHIVDEFTPYVVDLEERLGEIEDRMFESPSDDLIEDLALYNRILKKLRRTLTYQHLMMKQVALSNEGLMKLFDDHEFNDIYENMERLASLCQLNQELAVDLLNTYLSVASHRLNQIMRVLTIVTVIFMPLGLLAGIYGMNFSNMPELAWQYGYFTVLGVMAVIVATLFVVLRHKEWL